MTSDRVLTCRFFSRSSSASHSFRLRSVSFRFSSVSRSFGSWTLDSTLITQPASCGCFSVLFSIEYDLSHREEACSSSVMTRVGAAFRRLRQRTASLLSYRPSALRHIDYHSQRRPSVLRAGVLPSGTSSAQVARTSDYPLHLKNTLRLFTSIVPTSDQTST
ncbi:hypothetical protein BC834DRAFT_944045, partial [Gloeopeniophorella convolvens]